MLYESDSLTVSLDAGVATLSLDFAGPSPNLINAERLQELLRAWAAVEKNPAIDVLVLCSIKPAGFCAGYDPEALWHTTEDAREFARLSHKLTEWIAAAPFITIAELIGPVFGPGLDLALACDYRLAIATPTTFLGFPEIVHGLLPVSGITRLTRRVGAASAVEVLTAPGPFTAREALKSGLVDHAYSARRARIELRTFLDDVRHKPRRWQTPFDGWAARRIVAAYRGAATSLVTRALEIVPHAAASLECGLIAEQRAFTDVLASPAGRIARALHLEERNTSMVTRLPSHLVIVGPVEPVAELACETLLRGSSVTLTECEQRTVETLLQTALERGRLTPLEGEQARTRLTVAEEPTGADLVLLTRDTAQSLEIAEAAAKPGAVIAAVNCKLVSLSRLCSRPRQLAGIQTHVGSELRELIRTNKTAPSTLLTLRSWLAALGQSPLEIRQRSLVQRLSVAWWDEAVRLVADGLSIYSVDTAARSLGCVAGPLETLDGVGFENVAAQLPRVKPLIAAGICGRPHNDGFYVLSPDDATNTNPIAQLVLLETAAGAESQPALGEPLDAAAAKELCTQRLTARLLVAAVAHLETDSHSTAGMIDLAVIRGIGAFGSSGGILRHAEARGLDVMLDELRIHARRFGKRFKPPAMLVQLAAEQESFHGCPAAESRLRMTA